MKKSDSNLIKNKISRLETFGQYTTSKHIFLICITRPHGEMVKIFLGIFFKNFYIFFLKKFSLVKKYFFVTQNQSSKNFEEMIGS